MRNIFITLILSITLLMSGCANTQRLEIIAKPVDKPTLILPKADVLVMRNIDWTLLTPKNIDDAFSSLEKTGRPSVFFGTSDKGYQNLSLNMSSLRAFIQQQNAIILAYENYYAASNSAINSANNEIEHVNDQVDKINKKKSFWDNFKSKFTKTEQ